MRAEIRIRKRKLLLVLALLVLVGISASVRAEDPTEGGLGHRIAQILREKNVSSPLIVLLISTLPIVELRGAIPVAHHMLGMNPLAVYILAVLGNMIPVVPLLLFLGPASNVCMRFKLGRKFFKWFFERARRKSAKLEKYETLGLSVFVAIPLPITGAWTGCAAAFVMGMKFNHAFWAILLGVMVSGMIVTVLSLAGWVGAGIAALVLLALLLTSILKMFKTEQAA